MHVDQLKRNESVIENLAANLTREQAAWRPAVRAAPPRWTVVETVRHLIDIEVEDFRHDFELILFHPEERWPDFNIEEWRIERKYNDRDLQESIKQFVSERKKSIVWLQDLNSPDLDALHSGIGFSREPLRAGDILTSWVAHDLFHIRQLSLLRWDIMCEWIPSYSPEYSGFQA